ncbi:T9SS type A sorting domain-containing protein [Hymenobacter properus]|uniref:T9SS type A sorting domain-containing protein n=1 Tax=Hymenobacter properus TaxID=2791026 RepID=A0A931BFP5_9BACT|nr:T9SS type A sorting domain-containing protein [Hymenobacter properus]MBF9143060.1 T9SS type A sorting domain-containing protein [Hymenobacter properus]MBR7721868.1 T9SS type A sorting domain-containing protein [Microvirga sp. SRT04]
MKQTVPYLLALFKIWASTRFAGGLLLVAISLSSAAQTLDPTFHIPEVYGEGNVTDAAQMPNGQYVVGGTFIRANGQAVSNLARFDAAGATDQTFRQNLSAATVLVKKVHPMANGQLLVQGNYTAGAVQRLYLFRLNADGTLDATFNLALPGAGSLPEVTQVIVQPDGRILVLGLYLTGYSVSFDLFRVMSDGSRDTSFNAALTNFSQDQQMALQTDGKIVLGGSLSAINGVRQFFFARLNSDGSTDATYHPAAYTNARLYINSIALDANNSLLVGGLGINVINGQAVPLFRMLSSGAIDPAFTCPASLIGRDCDRVAVLPSGQLAVLMNTYSSVSSQTYSFDNRLFRLQANGAVDPTFQTGTGPDWALAEVRSLPGGNLLTWGGINNFAGQRRTVALLQPSGALDAGFTPLLQIVGSIQKIVRQSDGKLVIAGRFNTIDGHFTDRVARLLPTGQPDLSFAWRQPNSASWATSALAVQADGKVLLAGSSYTSNSFTGSSLNVQPVFTRLTTAGTADAGFVPGITLSPTSTPSSSSVQLVAEQTPGQLVVGGTFTDAAGKANLTRLTTTGAVDPTFVPPASQAPIYKGLVQANGNIVITASGPNAIQRLLPNGQPDPAFSYTLPTSPPTPGVFGAWVNNVFSIPATGGYVATGILSATEVLSKLAADGTAAAGFATPFRPINGPALPYNGISVVAGQSDGRLVVGGRMQQSSQFAAPPTLLARLEANGQFDPTFDQNFITTPTPAPSPLYSQYAVSDVLVQPDGALVVGGYFLQAGSQPVTGLVRLRPAGVLAVRSAQTTPTEAWPVPAHATLNLKLDAAARPQRVTLVDALGKTALTQPVAQAELTLNTATLARGLYVLRVDYATGPVTRRVVLE